MTGHRGAGVRLRPAGAADLDVLADMERELFGGEAWSWDLLASELRHAEGPRGDRCYLVAEQVDAGPGQGMRTGTVVGYAGAWFGDGRGEADLLTIATAPTARRRGVARTLARELIARVERAGCTAMLLEVRASNAPAQHLYLSLGFEAVGRRRGYYTAPSEDAVVMRLRLARGARPGPVGSEAVT